MDELKKQINLLERTILFLINRKIDGAPVQDLIDMAYAKQDSLKEEYEATFFNYDEA